MSAPIRSSSNSSILCGRWLTRARRVFQGLRAEDGAGLVEAAISLVMTISLAFWLFELSMMTYTCVILSDATHEGVRYATMHGTDSTACSGPDAVCSDHSPYGNVQATVAGITASSLHDMSAMTTAISYPDGNAKPGSRVSVVITYTYVPYINFPGLQKVLTFSSQGRITF